MPLPFRLRRPLPDEHPRHAELAESEGQEDVDRIHDHQGRDMAARIKQQKDRRSAHHQDAVLDREPVREGGEPVREPVVGGHVGHDPRPVDESRLGPDEQQGALGEDGDERQDPSDGPAAEHAVGQDGVERPPVHRPHPDQQVAEKDAAGRKGQGSGHIGHRLFPGMDAGLPKDAQAVGDRLDPGVSPPAHGKGLKEE